MTHDTTTAGRADTRDPAEIEREIRRTQADMSRTADRIGDQLTPRKLFDSLLDKADENGVDAHYLLDQARKNPIALGMIALGGLWLVSDSDARAKTITDKFEGLGGGEPAPGDGWDHQHHRGYVQHMAGIEPRADEDPDTFRRRRDCARASYLMIEQRHDEDENSWRRRLDDATDTLREQRETVAQKARDWSDSTTRQASRLSETIGRIYHENPLVGGLIAAVGGAIAGAAFPATRMEEEQLGEYGAQALDTAKDKAVDKAHDLADKADDKMRNSATNSDSGSGSAGPGAQQEARNRSFETV